MIERKRYEQEFQGSQDKSDRHRNFYQRFNSSPEIQRIIHLIMLNIKKKHMVVLDVGCGCGFFISKVADYCGYTIGLDISKSLLLRAKSDRNDCEFIVADAEFLPFRNDVFDLIFCVAVLHHIKGQSAESMHHFLNDTNRILQKDGVFLAVKEPNGLNIVSQIWFFLRKLQLMHKALFTFFPTQYEKPILSWELSRAMKTFLNVKTFHYQFFPTFIRSPRLMALQKILEKNPLASLFGFAVGAVGYKEAT